MVHLGKRFFGAVETVHAASCTFVVHYIKLLVEEGIELQLPSVDSLLNHFDCVFMHIVYYLLLFWNFEMIHYFLVLLELLRAEVNL